MQTMYDGVNGSPSNKLLNLINSSATSIILDSASNLPAAPNIATIGDSATAEVILYTGKSGSTLTGVMRGFGGTTAQSWAANTPVYRAFTKYDYDAIKLNINTIGDATSTNLLIDGGFQIWQAGTSFTNPASASYTATMWKVAYTADGGTLPTSLVHERILDPSNTTNNIYRITPNGAGSGFGVNASYRLRQQIEQGTRKYAGAGKTVTVSFRARSSIAGKKIGVMMYQSYGSGGSPTAIETINGNNFALTAGFQTFTHTFTLNTLSGKTFGTALDDSLYIDLLSMWGATAAAQVGASTAETFGGSGIIDIINVQLNYGSVALPFVPRGYADELTLCQRYYEKSYDNAVVPGTANNGTGIWFTNVLGNAVPNGQRWQLGKHPVFRVRKRIAPTITLYEYGGVSGQWLIGNATRASSAGADESGFYVANYTGGTITPTAGEAYGHWVADARM